MLCIRVPYSPQWRKDGETSSQVDSDVFDVLVVGVAAALRRAVAAMKGVLARGEEGVGEQFARAGPERPIDATLRACNTILGLYS